MYIFPCKRIRYIKLIAINTHIDCLNNSKCSLRYIFKATKKGALKVTLHHFPLIDPRGKISLFVGYSIQHAGVVNRLLNPKKTMIIHSRDVKWIGEMWVEFYKIKMIDIVPGYVDPDEDFQLEEEEDQDIEEEESKPEEDDSEAIQVGQSQGEE